MEFYNDSPSLRATFKFVKDFRKYDVFHDPTVSMHQVNSALVIMFNSYL